MSTSLRAPIQWGVPAWLLLAFAAMERLHQALPAWITHTAAFDVLGMALLAFALSSPVIVPLSAVGYTVSLWKRLERGRPWPWNVAVLAYSVGMLTALALSVSVGQG